MVSVPLPLLHSHAYSSSNCSESLTKLRQSYYNRNLQCDIFIQFICVLLWHTERKVKNVEGLKDARTEMKSCPTALTFLKLSSLR